MLSVGRHVQNVRQVGVGEGCRGGVLPRGSAVPLGPGGARPVVLVLGDDRGALG